VDPDEEFGWRDRLVRDFLGALGVAERLEEARQAIWDTWTAAVFQPFPDTLPFLDRLRADGYVVGVVSNWDPRLEQVVRNHGLRDHLDFLVVSEVEGYAKPSPRLFRRALEIAAVAPEEAVHVGDSFEFDVEGARGVGIQPIWLDRSGRGEQPFAPTVQTLDEAAWVLEGHLPLRGEVESGAGAASRFTELAWVQREMEDRLGFRPAPGTLNLRLARPADRAAWEHLRARPTTELRRDGFCTARLWRARLADGGAAALILPLVEGYPPDTVELLAPAPLRQSLGLRDGDTLSLSVDLLPLS
jgi:HAD superfamily hydrolase (TIGR01549 family)